MDRVDTSTLRLDYLGHVTSAGPLQPDRRRRLVPPVVVRDEVRLELGRARDGTGPRSVPHGAGRADADQPLSSPRCESQAVAGERGPGRLLDLLLEVEVGELFDKVLCGFDLSDLISKSRDEEMRRINRKLRSSCHSCHPRQLLNYVSP